MKDSVFAGNIPELYDSLLVPLIFEPYAEDMARRVEKRAPARVLEVAAGTGVVTRALDRALPAAAVLVASDLNAPMLERAQKSAFRRPIEWKVADALQLSFGDSEFDAVVCQFGAMFFPDKVRAFSEARRVLRPGGAYLFNVWDRIETNEFADVVTRALADLHPDEAPRFLARTPHGYHQSDAIRADLAAAGFEDTKIETLTFESTADSARIPALAYCHGTPLRNEIEAAGPLAVATDAATEAIARRFGRGRVVGKISAHVVIAART